VTLDALTLASGTIPVSGDLTVTVLGGNGKLVKQGDDTLTICFSTNTAGVQVDAGTLTLASSTNSVLGSLPALWLDASASGVFTQYKSYVFTNGFINIERWNDCRPGAPYYGYNNRGNDNQQVYPYVATNCLNGMPVVSMGSFQLTSHAPYIGPEAEVWRPADSLFPPTSIRNTPSWCTVALSAGVPPCSAAMRRLPRRLIRHRLPQPGHAHVLVVKRRLPRLD
jgi:hypothetical protein